MGLRVCSLIAKIKDKGGCETPWGKILADMMWGQLGPEVPRSAKEMGLGKLILGTASS